MTDRQSLRLAARFLDEHARELHDSYAVRSDKHAGKLHPAYPEIAEEYAAKRALAKRLRAMAGGVL